MRRRWRTGAVFYSQGARFGAARTPSTRPVRARGASTLRRRHTRTTRALLSTYRAAQVDGPAEANTAEGDHVVARARLVQAVACGAKGGGVSSQVQGVKS